MIGSCDTQGDLARRSLIGGKWLRRATVRIVGHVQHRPATRTHKESGSTIIMRHLACLATCLSSLALLALPAAADTTYTVRSGDSVWSIAKRHSVSYLAVLSANELAKDDIIRPGRQLTIPEPPSSAGRSTAAPQVRGFHVVRSGESLWLIARRYGTSVRALAAANDLRPSGVLRVGRRLQIPGAPQTSDPRPETTSSDTAAAEHPAPRMHRVRSGECLWTIARAYGTSVQRLAAANSLRPENILRPGRQLTIPDSNGGNPSADRPATKLYTVGRGDSLWRIARAHGTTVRSLSAANGLRPERILRVGTVLMVPATPGDSPISSQQGQHRFVQAALQYQGVRYRWGGMSTRGMDCSGLVARVLRNHGISAPHNAKALYNLGVKVSRQHLQSGDLVFFHTTRPGISHVGIYVGDGSFIHASSGKGRVRIDRMDTGYYSRRFVGAKRVA